jgi:hypothetical protein
MKSISFLSLLASVTTTVLFSVAAASINVPFVTIEKGAYSGIDAPLTEVYRTASNFQTFWVRHRSIAIDDPSINNDSPATNIPLVDFSRQIVIAVCMGVQNSGGYDIEIKSLDRGEDVEDENTLAVNFMMSAPSTSDMVTTALTQPYHIVRVDIPLPSPPPPTTTSDTDLEIVFVGSHVEQPQTPPPSTKKLIITIAEDADKDAISAEIELLPEVTNVEVMTSLPFMFVDFDMNVIGKKEAKELLGRVKGVNTIEEDS